MGERDILVIEDDLKTAELIRLYLQREGHTVRLAHNGREGLASAERARPAAIVLDLMLPGMDGLDICHALREVEDQPGVPILMLTARSTEEDMILGLDVGADDYLAKPFSPRELVARVRALLRRAPDGAGPGTVRLGELSIDLAARTAQLRDEPLALTPAEFELLATLMQAPGRAFSRQELLDRAFGYTYDGLPRTIDVHILKLRRKIEDDPSQPRILVTVYGHGYKFAESWVHSGGNEP